MYVRSVNPDGTLRVQLAGADITARTEMPGNLSVHAGSVLKGTVSFKDGKIYIKILPGSIQQNFSIFSFLASNGIPENPSAVFTAAFFYVSGRRLNPDEIKKIISLAGNFPGKEIRACEAASLLAQKGLPLTEENVMAALDVLEGRSIIPPEPDMESDRNLQGQGNPDSGNPDAGSGGKDGGGEFQDRFVSGDYEGDVLWYIYPYQREIAGKTCSGSLRVLFDRIACRTKESRLTFVDGNSSADFILTEDSCRFEFYPEPAPFNLRKITAGLKRMMEDAGINMDVVYGLDENPPAVGTVDIEV